jgi:hypothetical protein
LKILAANLNTDWLFGRCNILDLRLSLVAETEARQEEAAAEVLLLHGPYQEEEVEVVGQASWNMVRGLRKGKRNVEVARLAGRRNRAYM